MKPFSAILNRCGGVFLFAGKDGAKKCIESGNYRKDEYVGWLIWMPETLEILEALNPWCYVQMGEESKLYTECSAKRAVEILREMEVLGE